MLEAYQTDRINLIKDILPYFKDNFVLKGGTALRLYYGLNRFSEDIDFDCKSNNMNFISKLKLHKDFDKWNVSIKKDTDIVFRVMIDYGANSPLGNYPLKIEVSNRNKMLLQSNKLSYKNINGVNVYSINELVKMKINAFSGRDKIRDFYDIGFLLFTYPQAFSEDSLFSIYQKILYAGKEELNLLLNDEIKKHKLISVNDEIDITHHYAQQILQKIENMMNLQQENSEIINKKKFRKK